MKWLSSSIFNRFYILLLSNFLIFASIGVLTFYFAQKELDQHRTSSQKITLQKTQARTLWNEAQQVNLQVQQIDFNDQDALKQVNQRLTQLQKHVLTFSQRYSDSSDERFTNLLVQFSRFLDQELTLQILTDNQKLVRQSDSVVNDYFRMIHNEEKTAQQSLQQRTVEVLRYAFGVMIIAFFLLSYLILRLVRSFRIDLLNLVEQTKQPDRLEHNDFQTRHDEIGTLGKSMQQMTTLLAFEHQQTQTANSKLQEALHQQKTIERQLQFQNQLATQILRHQSTTGLHTWLQAIGSHFRAAHIYFSPQSEGFEPVHIALSNEPTYNQDRIELEAKIELDPSIHLIETEQLTLCALPLHSPSAFIGTLTLQFHHRFTDAIALQKTTHLLNIGLMRLLDDIRITDNHQLIQRILNGLREAILFVDVSNTDIFTNRMFHQLFPNWSPSEKQSENLEFVIETFEPLILETEALYAYVEQIKVSFENASVVPAQDFSMSDDRHLRLYTEFLPERQGILFVFRERTVEVNHAKKEQNFISVLSHELRTPLASIEGFSELMLHRTLSPSKQRKYLETMRSETQRLSQLLTEFLDYQRLSHQKETYQLESFCIERMLIELTEWLDITTSTHHLQIRTDGSCTITADPEKIRRVLLNILNNAIKYSPEDSNIQVSLACCESEIVITISDNGYGIPKHDLPYLFDPYYRVEHADHIQVQGTGLGLPICKEIIEAHGGRITVHSEIGRGSDFFIRLPRDEEWNTTNNMYKNDMDNLQIGSEERGS
ncbi:HAMP domain-containing sensor histidine kinase [Exiguobacterium acetylicum]|uniref:HAMP domain-containing sensor histidine kinase n=1 Tax=Exiguobacterium acetylicum TaxID=41170 RepID=UPI001EE24B28|nr:HAMP domain-containing sensor histidine kinase [Exiguobacterium acetylicum]UKS54738.1 HAMP domain-containing histidine kinase [Exiguobacterium acetylicum]